MNIHRLRERGWTETEITHLLGIMRRAEEQKHPRLKVIEHVVFWLMLITLLAGSVAITLELLPILMFSAALGGALTLLFGLIIGLLLVHALHDLRLERHHQHIGVVLLVACSIVAISFLLGTMQQRIGPLSIRGTLSISTLFAIGVLVPYFVHWRITHASS